jgi:hypothetical protein
MSPLLFSPIQLGGITLPNRVIIALCRRLLARRRPSLAGYVAFGAFGDNYERLAAIKKAYDPDNFFRANQNVT